MKVDPEMVTLAKQLVQPQVSHYDPADLEDRYETRSRTMIGAKLKGEGVKQDEPVVERSNVIDLMAPLTKSLGQVPTAEEQTNTSRLRF